MNNHLFLSGESSPGVGNLQGIAGHITRMIFSAGHISGLRTRSIFNRVQFRDIFASLSSSSSSKNFIFRVQVRVRQK